MKDLNVSRVESMFDLIGGKRASVNLNATMLDTSMAGKNEGLNTGNLNLPKLKLFD